MIPLRPLWVEQGYSGGRMGAIAKAAAGMRQPFWGPHLVLLEREAPEAYRDNTAPPAERWTVGPVL